MAVSKKNVIAGAFGQVHYDGVLLADVKSVDASIEVNRQEIQGEGYGMDSKVVSTAGTFSLEFEVVYTRGWKELQALKAGNDPRFLLTIGVSDPDAVGGQREQFDIGDAWLNKFNPTMFAKAEVVGKTFEGGFNPDKSDFADMIEEI